MNKSQEIHPELQPDFKPEMSESHHLPAWVWIVTIAVIGLFVIGLVAYGAYQYLNSDDQDGCITLYEPVCGKDGRTYSNSCVADLDGAEVDYMGKCEIDEFEDWQTYRNEEYGFEFRYPSSFGRINERRQTIVPPAGEKGESTFLEFISIDRDPSGALIFFPFGVVISFPDEYREPTSRCGATIIDTVLNREDLYYCKDVIIDKQDAYYTLGLEYIPECSGVSVMQTLELSLMKDDLKGTVTFYQSFSEIDQVLEPLYDCQDNPGLEETAYSYLEKIYRDDPIEPATELVSRFNKILSTFKFID